MGHVSKYCVQLWAPQYKKQKQKNKNKKTKQQKKRDLLERVQQRATKTIKGLEEHCYEEWLINLGLFSPEKRRQREDLISVYKYLSCGKQRDEATHPFSGV